jgi:hypothetical protein
MPFSYAVYTGNGSTTQFNVPFPYIRREHVVASLDYVSQVFTWVNNTTVEITPAPAAGVRVEVRRVTPINAPLVDFVDGSTLVAADLDTNALQQTYVNQEQDDDFADTISINSQGLLDAGGKRLTNLGNPTSAQDAATKTYVDTADNLRLKRDGTQAMTGALPMGGFKVTGLGTPSSSDDASTKGYVDSAVGLAGGFAAAASASASAAAVSESNAAASESAAGVSESNAAASESAAAGSASAAASSASTATTQAGNASSSASAASASATAASNSASNAAASAAAALAALDNFDDRYLGPKNSDPTVDNDGDPLVAGALYWNTPLGVMKVYTGTVWVVAYVPGDAININFAPYSTIASNNVQGAIQELTDEKLNLTGGALTGDLALNAQSDLRFADADSSHSVGFQAPSTVAANVTWTLPAADASVSGYALKSDGAGNLSWGLAGGASGGGANQVFYENDQVVTTSYTLTTSKNAMSAGPITINSGVTVTIPAGQFWSIV